MHNKLTITKKLYISLLLTLVLVVSVNATFAITHTSAQLIGFDGLAEKTISAIGKRITADD